MPHTLDSLSPENQEFILAFIKAQKAATKDVSISSFSLMAMISSISIWKFPQVTEFLAAKTKSAPIEKLAAVVRGRNKLFFAFGFMNAVVYGLDYMGKVTRAVGNAMKAEGYELDDIKYIANLMAGLDKADSTYLAMQVSSGKEVTLPYKFTNPNYVPDIPSNKGKVQSAVKNAMENNTQSWKEGDSWGLPPPQQNEQTKFKSWDDVRK